MGNKKSIFAIRDICEIAMLTGLAIVLGMFCEIKVGENGGASITATEVAEKRGTINYEVLCLLSDRVPRSYD